MTETSVQPELAQNQATYQRLKLALRLNLRRQLFLAVCDDLPLRDRLALRLQAELSAAHTQQTAQLWGEGAMPPNERLVTLKLQADDPNPLARVSQWLARAMSLRSRSQTPPAFQILGIEQLTRQPAAVQRAFWTHLQDIERDLPTLDYSLLLWMPQPWFRALPQSAPEFWRCRTAVFEFAGDPKPLPGSGTGLARHSGPAPAQSVTGQSVTAQPVTATSARSALAESAAIAPATRQPAIARAAVTVSATGSGVATPPALSRQNLPPRSQTVSVAATPIPSSTVPSSTISSSTISSSTISSSTISSPSSPPAAAQPQEAIVPAAAPALSSSLTRLPREWVAWEANESPPVSPQRSLQKAGRPLPLRARPSNPLPHFLPQSAEPPTKPPTEPPTGTATQTPAERAAGRSHPTLPAPSPKASQEPRLAIAPPAAATVQQLQQHIETLRQRSASAEAIAEGFCLLGEAYRDQIEAGDNSPETLRAAIEAYEQLLRWLPQDSELWSNVLNDLGNLYWMLSRSPMNDEAPLTFLSQSIQSYQMALVRLKPEDEAQGYPMIQNNLGVAYADLAKHRSLEENLQRSIQAYQEALRFRTPETDPLQYATTQNNLGTSYWTLAQHRQPQTHLKQAIAAYQEALRYYDAPSDPLSYGMIQNNLGTAYWNLAQHENPQDELRQAIAAYESALHYRTLDAAPLQHATTQNNLGTAYWHLSRHCTEQGREQATCLQQAVVAYERALQAVDQVQQSSGAAAALSFDAVSTRHHLGLAHYQLGTQSAFELNATQQRQHLESALRCHLRAQQSSQSQPDLYQTVLNSILQTVRAFHQQWGAEGQNWALSQIPGTLLTTLLPRL